MSWETSVTALLTEHNGKRKNGKVAADRTQKHRKEVVYTFFRRLYVLGYRVQDARNVGEKHIEVYLRDLWERTECAKTLQDYASCLRTFFGWIKPGLVKKNMANYLPDVDPKKLKVRAYAEGSKSWAENGVDVADVIQRAFRLDKQLGYMLMMAIAFGLRRKELVRCRPWHADRGHFLRVFSGEGKGTNARDIPIDTEEQRRTLDATKATTPKTKRMAWQYMGDGSGRRATLLQNEVRWSNYMRKLGITKDDLGVTGHNLRHQYCENYSLLSGFVPATLGGNKAQMDPEELELRQLAVSIVLGHYRLIITTAYNGRFANGVSYEDPAVVLIAGIVELENGALLEAPPDECVLDCITLMGKVAEADRIELQQSQVYALWKLHSARFGVKWVKPQGEVRAALEAAARHVIRKASKSGNVAK